MELCRQGQRQVALLAAFVVFIACFWLLVLSYSVHEAMPYTPIELPLAKASRVRFFIPQGWKFFTRNPREEEITAFRKNIRGEWSSALLPAIASSSNLFGIKRNTRAQGIEIGMILASTKKEWWIRCKERFDICIDKTTTTGSIPNKSPNATLCGEIVLVRQQTVPWAWSRAKKPVVMPSQLVRVDLSCSNPL